MINTGIVPRKLFSHGVLFLILVVLATLPLYSSSYSIVLLTAILMYIVLTASWVIFSGPTGYISLAPAAFFGVGIYTSAILGKELPLLLVVVIGAILSFLMALLIGSLTLRLKGIYFTIFTFGLVLLIQQLLLFYEVNITHTRGRFVVLAGNDTIYYVMLGILVASLLAIYFIKRSRLGLALQSIGDNEEAAAHAGINVTLVKVITFGISAFFMGAVGSIMATKWTYIDPYIAFNLFNSFLPVVMAIFGGMGQLYGPVVGATILAYLEELLITRFPYYYMLLFGLILLIAILYLPGGLVGLIQKWQKRGSVAQNAHS